MSEPPDTKKAPSATMEPETEDAQTINRTRDKAQGEYVHIGQRLAQLECGELKLFILLWGHTNHKTGQCNPGYRRLAKILGCCHQSIANWIAGLEKKKFLRVEKRDSKTGKQNHYTILNGEGEVFYDVRTLSVLPRKNAGERSTGIDKGVLPRWTRTSASKKKHSRKNCASHRNAKHSVAVAPSSIAKGSALTGEPLPEGDALWMS